MTVRPILKGVLVRRRTQAHRASRHQTRRRHLLRPLLCRSTLPGDEEEARALQAAIEASLELQGSQAQRQPGPPHATQAVVADTLVIDAKAWQEEAELRIALERSKEQLQPPPATCVADAPSELQGKGSTGAKGPPREKYAEKAIMAQAVVESLADMGPKAAEALQAAEVARVQAEARGWIHAASAPADEEAKKRDLDRE